MLLKTLIALTLTAATVNAQSSSSSGSESQESSIPKCAGMCLSNMLGLAKELGCDSDDKQCLCDSDDFWYGLKDCTNEACAGDGLEAAQKAANAMCPNSKPDVTSIASSATGSITPTVDESSVESTGSVDLETLSANSSATEALETDGSNAGGAAVVGGGSGGQGGAITTSEPISTATIGTTVFTPDPTEEATSEESFGSDAVTSVMESTQYTEVVTTPDSTDSEGAGGAGAEETSGADDEMTGSQSDSEASETDSGNESETDSNASETESGANESETDGGESETDGGESETAADSQSTDEAGGDENSEEENQSDIAAGTRVGLSTLVGALIIAFTL